MAEYKWSDSTVIAWEDQKGLCQICGERISLLARGDASLVGHHVKNRHQGIDNSPDNCRARHQCCERLAHQLDRYGNPTKEQLQWNTLAAQDAAAPSHLSASSGLLAA